MIKSNLFHRITRPEYFFQPGVAYRRVISLVSGGSERSSSVEMPWGARFSLQSAPYNVATRALQTYGVYDLGITEMLWRMIGRGDTVVDVGANIGYMTSLMAARVSQIGMVHCFEPNPDICIELEANIEMWRSSMGWHHITSNPVALSDTTGTANLVVQAHNYGESYIKSRSVENDQEKTSSCTVQVPLQRLDQFFEVSNAPATIKVDVEGHELAVLKGAENLLEGQSVQNVFFEEHLAYPSPVTTFLESKGFSVFQIRKGFWGPQLSLPHGANPHPWEPPNYLATRDPSRALNLSAQRGWFSLRRHTKNRGRTR